MTVAQTHTCMHCMAVYTLKGSANWCHSNSHPDIPIISNKAYADNAACEKACTENAKCQLYGRRHSDTWCEFWEAETCKGANYYGVGAHSVYQKVKGLCWLSRTLLRVRVLRVR